MGGNKPFEAQLEMLSRGEKISRSKISLWRFWFHPSRVEIDRSRNMVRPRRSLLFMPGSNARALEKARILAADVVILDLEDSVAPDAKGLARDQIAKAIAAGGFGKREIWIRTNALDTPFWVDDVKMAAKIRPDGILVPKVSSVEDIATIARCLRDAD